jgi:hypothetical protein
VCQHSQTYTEADLDPRSTQGCESSRLYVRRLANSSFQNHVDLLLTAPLLEPAFPQQVDSARQVFLEASGEVTAPRLRRRCHSSSIWIGDLGKRPTVASVIFVGS